MVSVMQITTLAALAASPGTCHENSYVLLVPEVRNTAMLDAIVMLVAVAAALATRTEKMDHKHSIVRVMPNSQKQAKLELQTSNRIARQ